MGLLTIILSGILILAFLIWIAWLTLRIARLEEEVRSNRGQNRIPGKELQRATLRLQSLVDELFKLSRRVEHLEDQRQRSFTTRPSAYPTDEHSERSADRTRMARTSLQPEQSVPESPTSSTSLIDNSVEIVSAFNALAASFDQIARDRFVSQFGPEQCAFDGTFFRADNTGAFWVLETGTQGQEIVLPSGIVARDWDKFYRQMDGMHAREVLGKCFEISDGGRLRILAPGQARRAAGHAELTARGQLSGV